MNKIRLKLNVLAINQHSYSTMDFQSTVVMQPAWRMGMENGGLYHCSADAFDSITPPACSLLMPLRSMDTHTTSMSRGNRLRHWSYLCHVESLGVVVWEVGAAIVSVVLPRCYHVGVWGLELISALIGEIHSRPHIFETIVRTNTYLSCKYFSPHFPNVRGLWLFQPSISTWPRGINP